MNTSILLCDRNDSHQIEFFQSEEKRHSIRMFSHLDTPQIGPSEFRTYTTTGTVQGRTMKERGARESEVDVSLYVCSEKSN